MKTKPPMGEESAQRLLGENILTSQFANKVFGRSPAFQPFDPGPIPFDEATIWASRATHVLVAVPPLSLLDMFRCFDDSQQSRVWYQGCNFALERGSPSWRMVRKTQDGDMRSKTWFAQIRSLSRHERPAPARVAAYLLGIYRAVFGSPFQPGTAVRCADTDENAQHLVIEGEGGKPGFQVYRFHDRQPDARVGLISEVK